MENNAYIERIHRYLADNMDEKDKAAFEEEMHTNEELEQDVKLEAKLLSGIALVGDQALKSTIANTQQHLTNQQFFDQGKVVSIQSFSKRIIMKKIVSIAAVAVVLIGIVWWGFFRQPATPDTAKLFADNFKPEATMSKAIVANLGSHGFASDSMSTADSLRTALVLYDAGKYPEAMVALDTFLVNHPANDTAQFYLGMTHLNESRYARAVEILSPISASETSAFRLDAMWYLGLCYFKVEGGFSKAEDIFNQLAVNAESKDQQAAKGILQMIGH